MDENLLRVLEFDRIRAFLASFCETPLGRSRAARLAPSTDAATVETTLAGAREMHRLLQEGERFPLVGVDDLAPVLDSLHKRGHPVDEEEILRFKDTLESACELRRRLGDLAERAPSLHRYREPIRDFEPLLGRFDLTVDTRGRIRDDASPRLAEIRRRLDSIRAEISDNMRRLVSSPAIRSVLREPRSFYRNGRYVLPVKAESRGHVKGMIHDFSHSGHTVFVEPEETIPLGNELGDQLSRERREISRILFELTQDLLAYEPEIREALEVIGWIDLTQAKGRYAVEHDLEFADRDPREIVLRAARHPLLVILAEDERGRRSVVPIDVRLGGDYDLLILTGPNTGGKTVTLKTVGLLALMNQAGLAIPAGPGSRLPLFRSIEADIGDEQSIEQSLSTFSAHMVNISRILRGASPESLILLDELGAGTDPSEGAALGIGILDHLDRLGARAIVTTHIGSLKAYPYENPRASNASVQFDVETLAPTYRLVIGRPGNSNAVTIARRIGMPEPVLERAAEILSGEADRASALVERLESTLVEAERRRDETEAMQARARGLEEASERIREEVERRRGLLCEEADRRIDSTLRNLRSKIEPELHALEGAVPATLRDRVARIQDRVDEALQGTSFAARREAYIRKLKKEQMVMIPKYRQRGRVQRVSRDKRTVSVVIGSMSLEVPFEEVAVPPEEL